YGLELLNIRVIPLVQDGVRAFTNLSLNANSPFSSTDKLGRERRRQWKQRKVSKLPGLPTEISLVDLEFDYDFNDNVLYRKDRQAVTGRDDRLLYDRLDRLIDHE